MYSLKLDAAYKIRLVKQSSIHYIYYIFSNTVRCDHANLHCLSPLFDQLFCLSFKRFKAIFDF